MPTTVSTIAELISWSSSGGTGTVLFSKTGTFTIDGSNSSSFPLNIGTTGSTAQDTLINGQRMIITINNVANFKGLFFPRTIDSGNTSLITIEKLIVNYTGTCSLAIGAGTFKASTNATYGSL